MVAWTLVEMIYIYIYKSSRAVLDYRQFIDTDDLLADGLDVGRNYVYISSRAFLDYRQCIDTDDTR